jgi:hypothetical protein
MPLAVGKYCAADLRETTSFSQKIMPIYRLAAHGVPAEINCTDPKDGKIQPAESADEL